jgi:hypothetical protein
MKKKGKRRIFALTGAADINPVVTFGTLLEFACEFGGYCVARNGFAIP